jgi:hypothetical protein
MELFVALILIFLGGTASYGISQLWVGARDLLRQALLTSGRATKLCEAREGRVLLRGEARAARKLLPALSRESAGVVAYATRSSFGSSGDESSTTFELFDGTGVARIEAEHAVLVGPESSDVFGALTREIRPGDQVTILGSLERVVEPAGTFDSYREPPTSLVVRDLPRGAGLIIHRKTWQPLRNVAKGAFALAVSAAGVVVAIGAIG